MNDTALPPDEAPATPANPAPRASLLRRRAASIATLTGLAVGGVAGGLVIGHAATASPSPSATASPSGGAGGSGGGPMGCPHGGPGGLQQEDLTLVAKAIGISASDLQTALRNGQTIAAVAKAHNVDVNTVISAWVASENKEIDDRASSGQITQQQAAQMKAMTQQRITDEVNGTRPAGGPGRPGLGGPGSAPGDLAPGAPAQSDGTST